MSAIQKMTKIWYDPSAPRHRVNRKPQEILQEIVEGGEHIAQTYTAPPPTVRENIDNARLVAQLEHDWRIATRLMTDEQRRAYAARNWKKYQPLLAHYDQRNFK